MVDQARRRLVQGAGVGVFAFWVGGCRVELTPEEAKQQGADYTVLSSQQVKTLDALGDVLVPNSSEKGLANYVDFQLSQPFPLQMLMLKYLNVNPPFTEFYTGGLDALDQHAQTHHQNAFHELSAAQQKAVVTTVAQSNPPGWQGPPGPFFYFVLRSDAVDVVYGTQTGFEALGIPYAAHINPPSPWGQ